MKKLIEIQNEVKVPKGNYNSFGKYKYRSAENILESIKPILLKHDATVLLSDNVFDMNGKTILKSICTLFLDGKEFNTFGFAEITEHKGMSMEQCYGTASSYARKYALNGMFLIDETESDADAMDNKTTKTEKPAIKDEDITKAIEYAKENGIEKLKSLKTLTKLQEDLILAELKK